jgi:AmiR/NasT family two-component response regulator
VVSVRNKTESEREDENKSTKKNRADDTVICFTKGNRQDKVYALVNDGTHTYLTGPFYLV